MRVPKWMKAIAGAILILLLLVIVNRWYAQYKTNSEERKSTPTTETASPKGEGDSNKTPDKNADQGKKADQKPTENAVQAEAKTAAKVVIVLTDGLNFRDEPSQDSNVIRGLDKGEKLTLVKTENGWHQVRDDEGTVGWISASSQYSKVQ